MKNLTKVLIIAFLTLLLKPSITEANYAKICSINCDSNNVVEIIFIPADSALSGSILKYELYKKNNSQQIWNLVSYVLKDSLTIFYDTVSSPVDSNIYRILTIDTNNVVLDSTNEKTYVHLEVIPGQGNAEFVYYILSDDSTITSYEIWSHDNNLGTDNLLFTTGCCFILQHNVSYFFNSGNSFPGGNYTFNVRAMLANPCIPTYNRASINYITSNYKIENILPSANVGLNENKNIEFTVYPNPSNKGNFFIKNSFKITTYYTLYSLSGELIMNFNSNQETIHNTLEINPGFYILKAENKYGVLHKKIQIIL